MTETEQLKNKTGARTSSNRYGMLRLVKRLLAFMLISAVVVAGFVGVFMWLWSDDQPESKTTSTLSEQFATLDEKRAFLKRYGKIGERQFTRLEYSIELQDNSVGFVPGPSDWVIALHAIVPNDAMSQWINGLEPLSGCKPRLDWVRSIPDAPGMLDRFRWYQDGMNRLVGVDLGKGEVLYFNHSALYGQYCASNQLSGKQPGEE